MRVFNRFVPLPISVSSHVAPLYLEGPGDCVLDCIRGDAEIRGAWLDTTYIYIIQYNVK